MSKYETCEQFVLAQMFKEQKRAEQAEAKLAELTEILRLEQSFKKELITKLQRYMKIETPSSQISRPGDYYISTSGIWTRYEPEDFEFFKNALQLTTPEEAKAIEEADEESEEAEEEDTPTTEI